MSFLRWMTRSGGTSARRSGDTRTESEDLLFVAAILQWSGKEHIDYDSESHGFFCSRSMSRLGPLNFCKLRALERAQCRMSVPVTSGVRVF